MVAGYYICSITYIGKVMPYSKAHKARSRERILQQAASLFPRLGYEAVSIDMLMAAAGLTRGAFYAHFADKSEVYAESIRYASLNNPFAEKKVKADALNEWFESTVGKYLSREHIDEAPLPCPLAFLVTDINRREEGVRDTYTRVYKKLNRVIEHRVKEQDAARETIMALTAMMIGGVAVARALSDERTTDKLLEACLATARDMLNID